jgi:hypothetical protein
MANVLALQMAQRIDDNRASTVSTAGSVMCDSRSEMDGPLLDSIPAGSEGSQGRVAEMLKSAPEIRPTASATY